MPTKFCRHIKINGERCGSPALTNQVFCYYHVEIKRRHGRCNPRCEVSPTVLRPISLQDGSQRDPIFAEPTEPPFQLDLPPLEDRHSIQIALSMVITALAEGRIDSKHAAMLFYGLQVASSNAHKLNPSPKRDPGKVSKTVLDSSGSRLIAPDEDPEDPEETQSWERPGTATRYWNMLQAEEKEKERRKAEAAALFNGGTPAPQISEE